MKVSELIERLQAMPEYKDVYIRLQGGAWKIEDVQDRTGGHIHDDPEAYPRVEIVGGRL